MVKLLNPLFSNTASGRFGGLIYESGPWGPYAKALVPQHRKPTAKQIQQNYFFGIAADSWRELTDAEKAEWNVKARGMKMTGFNLYIKENIEHP